MELFRSDQYYIFVKNESSLWWNRFTGAFSVRSAWDLSDIEDIECMGITEGIIGKVEHTNIFEPRLILIKESVPIGQLYFHHTIHKVKSICFLNSGATNQELDLCSCTKHGSSNSMDLNKSSAKKLGSRLFENSAFLNKTVGAVKNVSNTIKTTTQQAATQVKQTVKKQRDPKVAERFEKRLSDELIKIFEDTGSFYYSRTLDLTNSLQRQCEIEAMLKSEEGATKPPTDITRWWKHVDDRFFWNKYMLRDIISLGSPQCDQWVLPIIQGYINLAQIPIQTAEVNPLNTESLCGTNTCDETFTLGVISRRSRFQAGTRYNRRGIEANGKVANYVETEQVVSIICADNIHRASFLQVRGSVPIFWSQPEHKFRPPLQLDKTEEESHEAFSKHFEEEIAKYKQVCIVNLVEQQGRERVIWDAFGSHVLKYNSPDIIYATFDFHEYCKGMHYENVSILINALTDVINEMRFCWRDDQGLICGQNGVFRVNCVDCLDRTNVVQTAIAKYVLELQLCRLGVGALGAALPPALRQAFLTLWADNGDMISRQYAGTPALKGDYTRTGERKLTGMMKDGVASANRYYLSTFKDALRQAAIDVMTGESRSIPEQLIIPDCSPCTNVKMHENRSPDAVEDIELSIFPRQIASLLGQEDTPPSPGAMAQHVKSLIDDCKRMIVASEPSLGAWGLIDADPVTGNPQETEMDIVLLLTQEAYYVADYDDNSDRVLSVRRVSLKDVTAIELAIMDNNSTLFNVGRKPSEPVYCIRIHYQHNNEGGYFHTFRSTSLRFFNNVPVAIRGADEMIESLHSICESILVARDVAKLPPIPFHEGGKLDKRKSKVTTTEGNSGFKPSQYLDLSTLPTLTKNVSETQLVADIRSVGSKALTNMSEQFSKLNRLGARAKPSLQLKFDQGASKTKKMFTLGSRHEQASANRKKGSISDGQSSDYSSDDEARVNIFEPTLDNFENHSFYIGKSQQQKETDDCELIQNPLYSSKIEPNETETELTDEIVIPAYDTSRNIKTPQTSNKKNPFNTDNRDNIPVTPLIHVDEIKPNQSNPLVVTQKLSHSSSDLNVDNVDGVSFHVRSNSQQDIALNISQSHSESALKQLRNIASPVSSATKDMVLSPLSKFAKGVQNLGSNLDPRKIKAPPTVKNISEQQYEEHRKLQEKWRDCNTRLVAL